jgi:adenine/guanine phosphoribosyltransferase-like PRPP-binding protein
MKTSRLLAALEDAAMADLELTTNEELLREAAEDGEDVAGLAAESRSRIAVHLQEADRAKALPLNVHRSSQGAPAEPFPSITYWRTTASSMLVELQDACRTRYCSFPTFNSKLPDTPPRFEESMAAAERLLTTYLTESGELTDLFPESRATMLRTLLHEAMHDEQIARFVHLSLGTLVSTLCTLALGKASGFGFDTAKSSRERNRLLRKIRGRKDWQAFRNLMVHQPELIPDELDASRAINGLAAMQSALRAYRPDAIVAVEGGGEIVANFLRGQIGLDPRSYFTASQKRNEYVLDRDLKQFRGFERIVVIDDIARTGRTLTCICNQTLGAFTSLKLKVLTLVSAAAATDPLRDLLLVLPIVSHSANVSVPWDNKGSYKTTRTNHVFGADRRSPPLKVPKTFYDRIYSDRTP